MNCSRCGRAPHPDEPIQCAEVGLPVEWTGTKNESVCPGCQYVEWHPHCTSLVDVMSGERVDPRVDWAAFPREECDFNSLTRCEYIDMTISITIDDPEWVRKWTCPNCGGTEFDYVRRDYLSSGLQPGSFTVDDDV